MSYNYKKSLDILFNIDDVQFKTFQELPEDIRFSYLYKFKKSIGVDDFDEFVASHLDLKYKNEALKLFGIDDNSIGGWTKSDVKYKREKNVQFNRELKIKLLCQ
jgi:hypothetical protein